MDTASLGKQQAELIWVTAAHPYWSYHHYPSGPISDLAWSSGGSVFKSPSVSIRATQLPLPSDIAVVGEEMSFALDAIPPRSRGNVRWQDRKFSWTPRTWSLLLAFLWVLLNFQPGCSKFTIDTLTGLFFSISVNKVIFSVETFWLFLFKGVRDGPKNVAVLQHNDPFELLSSQARILLYRRHPVRGGQTLKSPVQNKYLQTGAGLTQGRILFRKCFFSVAAYF